MMGGEFSNVTNEAIMPAWQAMLNRVVFLEEVHELLWLIVQKSSTTTRDVKKH